MVKVKGHKRTFIGSNFSVGDHIIFRGKKRKILRRRKQASGCMKYYLS